MGILSIVEDLKKTSQIEKDSQDIFEEDGGNGAGYVGRVLDSYLKFKPSSTDQGRIVVKKVGDNALTEKDIPNILFAFAQHRELIENPSMITFLNSTDEDRAKLLKIIDDLSSNLAQVINSIQTQNKNGELDAIIEEVNELRLSTLKRTSEERTVNNNRFKSTVNQVKNLRRVIGKPILINE